MKRMKIKEIRDKSNTWWSKYLYEKSPESRNYSNVWSKFMDSQDFIKRGVDFTGLVTGQSRRSRELVVETNKQFFNRLHSSCFTRKSRIGKQIQRWVVIEKGIQSGFHSHMILEIPRHLSEIEFKLMILECWKKTKHGKKTIGNESFSTFDSSRKKSFFTKESGDFSLGFGGYSVKQFNRTTDTVDTNNSYWI